jgi:signal transduction histidine kinase
MDGEVRRLGRLVDDLARLHDQVAGTLEIARQPVALSDWLVHALAPWREAAQGKGLRWEADIASDLPILDIDPDRLAQAVSNLTSNAIKYTRLGGVVSVAAGVKDKEVWIQVSDTGPGIPLEEQPHIFTRFFRGRMGRRFPQGMGLGLSIARDLVVAHGGRLEMKTAPGRGSDFTLWLPLN